MASHQTVRRIAGLISRYFSDSLLKRVEDPRSAQGRRWSALPLLKAVLLGLTCGCKGLTELEELTAGMHGAVKKLVGIPKRIPDTTLRDYLCRLDPKSLCALLSVIGYDAWRRKALRPAGGFPFAALSLDGKYPAIRDTEASTYLQVKHNEAGAPTHGLLRTITATLVTAEGRPILGAVPVPAGTNEQGCFQQAFGEMVRIYGRLFRLVMYDAGAASLQNADAVLKAGKHYFFQLADDRWVMHQTLALLLADKAPMVSDEMIVSSCERVVRHLSLVTITPTHKNVTVWEHAKTALKVTSETYKNGLLTGTLTRYFVTSLESRELSPKKWLELVIVRWGVETAHQILDVAFSEDDRPWITADAQGALAVMLLRRVAYTILTLYRSVTQRSDDNRILPFRRIMEWIKDTLKWPNPGELQGFRPRRFAVPPALA